MFAVRCAGEGEAQISVWVGSPRAMGSQLLAVRQEDVGQGFAVPAGPGVVSAARRGELTVEVNGIGLDTFAWRGVAAVVLLPFLCDFEQGTACGVWSFVRAAELCNGADDDCDGAIDDGALCDDGLACTSDQCAGAGGCLHPSTCASGLTCCATGCADLQTSTPNCGACGQACNPPHANPACAGGVCGIAGCLAGYSNCDGIPANGCEANLNGDPWNCGSCGYVCNLQNANSTCSGAVCIPAGCVAGYGNCDGLPANGCETNTTNTAAHCGACNQACPAPPNATAACVSSSCAFGSCLAGYANCNGLNGDGCEANVASDPSNCGGCGISCPSGHPCSGGHCI